MKKSQVSPRHPHAKKIKFVSSIAMKIGFIISLSLTIFAFNWTTYPGPEKVVGMSDIDQEEEVKVVRTIHKEKRVAPPTIVKPSMETFFDEPEFDPEPDPPLVKDVVVVEDPSKATDLPVVPYVEPKEVLPPPAPLEVEEPEVEIIWEVVEQMPRFKGCENMDGDNKAKQACAESKLLEYFYKQINYPAPARANNVEGLVVVQFVVEKDGSISDVKVVKDIGAGCGKETIRVTKGMPGWIPGKQRGEPVAVRYNLPVRFRLH